MRPACSALLLVPLAFLLAGCLAPGGGDALHAPAGDASGTGDAGTLPAFELVGTDCIEGGGQSVVPRSIAGTVPFQIPPEPWERADVLEDTGPQLVYTQVTDPLNPIPREGHTWGHMHATLWCSAWTFNGAAKPGFVFGYVGAKVEAPAFGDDSTSRDYLVTVIAANDKEVRDALHAAGIHATDVTATMELDDLKLHTVLDTHHHGAYESMFLLKELGEMPSEPFRLWWQSAREGGFAPVAIDMAHSAGAKHFGAEGQAYFSHTGTHMHGPQGGAWSPTAAALWVGHDRVITLGPAPDVRIDTAYEH